MFDWKSLPLLTGVFLAAIIAVFLYQLAIDPNLVAWFQLYGPDIARGQWWRILSHTITHQSPIHALFNAMVIFQVGSFLERGIGTGRLALLSLVGAVWAAAAVLLFDFGSAAIGASGVGLAWIGVEFVLGDRAHKKALLPSLVVIALISLMPGIALEAHLGGFLSGLALAAALRRGKTAFSVTAVALLAVGAGLCVWAVSVGGVRLG